MGRARRLCGMSDPTNPWQQSDLLGLLDAQTRQAEPQERAPHQDRQSKSVEADEAALEPTGPVPRTLLIVDTETTALSPSEGTCIEVGAILFAVPERAVLSQLSFLLPCRDNPAEAINRIPAGVTRLEQPLAAALSCFAAMVNQCDALLAHNAAFDRQWFAAGAAELPLIDKPWICSMSEMRWPVDRQLKANPSVRDLALAYGIPVWAAHRALTDCTYLAQVLERCDTLETLLLQALEPRSLFRAQLSYAERHRAKDAGFRWNDPVRGAWSKRLSQREARALPFPVQAVEDLPASA